MDELANLVTASRTGDVQAYAQLVRRFQHMAYGYACSILGDAQLAEDASQEAFIEAFDRLGSLQHALAFPTWLRRIVLKHCDRQTRGKSVKAVVHAYPEPICLEWEPSGVAERREITRRVRRAVHTLPEHQREMTTLFYLKGCSQQDICAFLDVPISTIKKRLQQARHNLKHSMSAVAEEALRKNYLDQAFVTHVVAGLLSRPSLLKVEAHPVQRVWNHVQGHLRDYEVVEGDEFEDTAVARATDSDSFSSAYHVDEQLVLRAHAISSLWQSLRGRTPPVRILTAGRAFRDCAEGSQSKKAFHQIEGICVDYGVHESGLKTTVNTLLRRLLGAAGDIRWLEVPSEAFSRAYRIAVRNEHGVFPIGTAGMLKPHKLRDVGVDTTSAAGFAFGFGAERLAMLKLGIQDIRDLLSPKYCPVVDNFSQLDLKRTLSGRDYAIGDAVTTPISGVIPGGGRITPGRTWLSDDGVLHIRGETITGHRIEGGWEGTETIDLNIDLNQETGIGIVRNTVTDHVVLPERGLRGALSGGFTGEIREGGARGCAVFDGSGGFEGLKAVVQATTPDLAHEPFQFDGVIIEPPRK